MKLVAGVPQYSLNERLQYYKEKYQSTTNVSALICEEGNYMGKRISGELIIKPCIHGDSGYIWIDDLK